MKYAIYKTYYEPSKIDLYLLWNIETQLLASLPMDLYTLSSYIQLIEIGQDLLIDNWENLKAYNSSIPNYKPRFTNMEKIYLHKLAPRSNVITWAVHNRAKIKDLEEYLDIAKFHWNFRSSIPNLNLSLFHHLHYFKSLDYTYHTLLKYKEEINEYSPDLDLRTFMDGILARPYLADGIVDFFIDIHKKFNFPIEAIPHLIIGEKKFLNSVEHIPYTLSPDIHNNRSWSSPANIYEVEVFPLSKKDKLSILNDIQHLEDEELSSFYKQSVKSFFLLSLVDFDEKSIDKLFESLNIPCKYYVNLKHEELGILLPPLYESVVDVNKELVVFKRFGANIFDLYSKTGLFLETVNQRLFIYESGLYVIEGETQAVLKHFDTEDFSKRTVFEDLEIKTYDIKGYDWFFIMDDIAYSFKTYEQHFPNDCLKIKVASEGLFAICRNGYWEYRNWSMDNFRFSSFGYAGPFIDGFAKVLKLKPEYDAYETSFFVNENLISMPTHVPIYKRHKHMDKYEPRNSFPYYSREHLVPFRLMEEDTPSVDYAKEYNFFGFMEEDAPGYGTWSIIDKDGDIVFEAEEGTTIKLLENGFLRIETDNGVFMTYDINRQYTLSIETLYKSKSRKKDTHPVQKALKEKFQGVSEDDFKEVIYTGYDDEYLPPGHPAHLLMDTVGGLEDKVEFDVQKNDDEVYMKEMIVKDWNYFKESSARLKDSFEFMLFSTQYASSNLVYKESSKRLQVNTVFIKYLISLDVDFFKCLPKTLRENSEIFEFAFSKHLSVISYIKPSYPNYMDLVFESVKKEAKVFEYLPLKLKSDQDFVLKLIDINPSIINYFKTYHFTMMKILEKIIKIDPSLDKYGLFGSKFLL